MIIELTCNDKEGNLRDYAEDLRLPNAETGSHDLWIESDMLGVPVSYDDAHELLTIGDKSYPARRTYRTHTVVQWEAFDTTERIVERIIEDQYWAGRWDLVLDRENRWSRQRMMRLKREREEWAAHPQLPLEDAR